MANESKVIQIDTIGLHSMTNDAHFMYITFRLLRECHFMS